MRPYVHEWSKDIRHSQFEQRGAISARVAQLDVLGGGVGVVHHLPRARLAHMLMEQCRILIEFSGFS
jgi:hypothetical protein